MDFLIESINFGFGLMCLLFILLKRNSLFLNHWETAVWVIKIGGAVVLIKEILNIATALFSATEFHHFLEVNRIFGPYWFAYWHHSIVFLIVSLVFWLIRPLKNNWLIFSVGLMLQLSYFSSVFYIYLSNTFYIASSWLVDDFSFWHQILKLVTFISLLLILNILRLKKMFTVSR